MKKTAFIFILFILGVFVLSFSKNRSSNVIVGIMEDDRRELANWKEGPSKNRIILPSFEKKGNEWALVTYQPDEIQWTIAFDGRNAGTIQSRPETASRSYLGNAYIHAPEPQVGQRLILGESSPAFSGWCNTRVNRPLVLVSKQNFSDPDKWKRFRPSEDQIKSLKSMFRSRYAKVMNCDEKENPLPNPWQYKDSDIRTDQSYLSKNGNSLVGMFLEGGRCGINNEPFTEQLFLIKADQSVVPIFSRSNRSESSESLSLTLVDAGDYDKDGQSEVIFFLSGYNEDGYALFYDSFRQSVQWTFHYH
jgi:hypothetical protein